MLPLPFYTSSHTSNEIILAYIFLALLSQFGISIKYLLLLCSIDIMKRDKAQEACKASRLLCEKSKGSKASTLPKDEAPTVTAHQARLAPQLVLLQAHLLKSE